MGAVERTDFVACALALLRETSLKTFDIHGLSQGLRSRSWMLHV